MTYDEQILKQATTEPDEREWWEDEDGIHCSEPHNLSQEASQE